jgi:hypothetical protein
MPGLVLPKTLNLKGSGFVRSRRPNRRRGKAREAKNRALASQQGKPEGLQYPREQAPPTGTNPFGRKEGDGFPAGSEPLERRWEADKVFQESAGTDGVGETPLRSAGRKKALKGESHERRKLKDAFWDAEVLTSPGG